ncbi:hypothetical protein [Fischerella sp. PCC 9605]|uniref:hypothetical protein n=1 Tax=Fischerella sp. PCC 9605 TaxID=1173024 RepID=UPI00047A6121|nr:hypothetical protein [Fischerella sp. PCC 9605]
MPRKRKSEQPQDQLQQAIAQVSDEEYVQEQTPNIQDQLPDTQEDTPGSLLVQDEAPIQQQQPQSDREDINQEEIEYSPLVRKLAAIASQEIALAREISAAKNEAIVDILRNGDERLLERIDGTLNYRRREYSKVVEDLGKGDLW